MLDADAPLPQRPHRVLVAGVSGSGKTTLAARIAELLNVQHVEIDGLFHGPDWTPRPSFAADVEAFTSGPAWVTEWQYGPVRQLLVDRADLLVWLDLPYWRVTVPRLVVRTLRRRLRRQVLWNGNVEPPLWTMLSDPEHILRWSFRTRKKNVTRIPPLAAANEHLVVVRLRSPREVERWLAGPLQESTC